MLHSSAMPAEAIIIGAGIAGASAAYELAKVVPVIILERRVSAWVSHDGPLGGGFFGNLW